MEAFVAFIAQYYAHNPLPNEILIPREYDAGMLRELYGEKIVQPQRGDKVKLVEMALRNAKNAHEQKFTLVERKDQQKQLAMGQLSRIFQKEIHRIEIFDNSHLAGTFNVSGMVVFLDGEPHKPGYRLYRLGEYRSDMDSMREVLYRRYFRLLKEGAALPDLLVVDGGYQQVEAAKEIRELLDLDLPICGLVKDEHHNTSNLMDDRGTIIPIEKEGPLFFLLAQMQDEVHRFAISYHRRLRKKAMTRSILDEVEGLGEVRKKAIWKKFGSLKNLRAASVEEIRTVVPEKVAENIYHLLHNLDQIKNDA